MNMNSDPDWLRKMAKLEDGCPIGAGELHPEAQKRRVLAEELRTILMALRDVELSRPQLAEKTKAARRWVIDAGDEEVCEGCQDAVAMKWSDDDVHLCWDCFQSCDVTDLPTEPQIINLGDALKASVEKAAPPWKNDDTEGDR